MTTTDWILDTHGDPIGSVRKLLQQVWVDQKLEAMLVPTNGSPLSGPAPHILGKASELEEFNPFKPLMTTNAAGFIPDFVQAYGKGKLASLLRPCELRALVEMVKHDSFTLDNMMTICVDCLGTYPLEEYQWRSEHKGASDHLEQETIQFARQGGLLPYRYRAACQMCTGPNASVADLNIGVIGLPVRKVLLVAAKDEATAERLKLDQLTDGVAEASLSAQRDRTVSKLVERNSRVRERIRQGLAEVLPTNIDELIRQFGECESCTTCMQVCPICTVDFPRRGDDGSLLKADVERWLISCAGCGVCEQTCPRHQPLSAIFGAIRQQLADPFDYEPGRSFKECLPL